MLRHQADWTYCNRLNVISFYYVYVFVFRIIICFDIRRGYGFRMGTGAITTGDIRYISQTF